MSKVIEAVVEVDQIINSYMKILNQKYEDIQYLMRDNYLQLQCNVNYNTYKKLSIGTDFLESRPSVKSGGRLLSQEQFTNDIEAYESKKKRIESKEGLKIEFSIHREGKRYTTAPKYTYDKQAFIKDFELHFL